MNLSDVSSLGAHETVPPTTLGPPRERRYTVTARSSEYRISSIAATELDEALQARWRALCAHDPCLGSPYFSVDYLLAASQACTDVHVGVIEVNGKVQGFFPFQLKARRIAGPVGGQLSDWHGIVGRAADPWDMRAILRGCCLDIWDFDHLPRSQALLHVEISAHGGSPILDLGQGFDAYLQTRKAAGSRSITQFQRRARKLEREHGTLRFEADCRDRRAFQQVLQWKREQCQRTCVPDFLSWRWSTELLERIWALESPGCAGRLSVLWCDETIVAAHYGMRSATDWHWWLPTYNKDFAEYSPGVILLLRLAEAAAAAGVQRIDLGKGGEFYKQLFASGEIALVEGSVLVPSLTRTRRRTRWAAQELVQRSALLRKTWAAIKPLRDRLTGASAIPPRPVRNPPQASSAAAHDATLESAPE